MSSPRPAGLDEKSFASEQAYHGTTIDRARQIESEGFKIPSSGEHEDRFGPGVYFWENSANAARRFVESVKRVKAGSICVIRAKVDCERILDLLTADHFRPYMIIANVIAREKRMTVNDVKPAAVLSVMKTAGWIDGARVLAPHRGEFRTVGFGGQVYGPCDVILCIYAPEKIVVRATQVF